MSIDLSHVLYLLQATIEERSSNPIACVDNPLQAVTVIVGSAISGGGFLVVWLKSFFDAEKARIIAGLEAEIRVLQTERTHLNLDIEEYKTEISAKSKRIEELQLLVDRLQEDRHSGFNTQLTDLQQQNYDLRRQLGQAVGYINRIKQQGKQNESNS